MPATAAVPLSPAPPPPAPQAAGLPALRVEGLAKHYAGPGGTAVPVFSDIGFTVTEGQSVAIIGANGTGKSTLLRCCLRLIEPDSGRIHLHGRDLAALHGPALRRERGTVGFVFQKHNLVPRLSVLSNVLHGAIARRAGVSCWFQTTAPRRERERALHCLDQVGLAHLAGRRADQLSGGQSQRVAIARALMQGPSMIFADEPVSSLDPQAGAEVMAVFSALVARHGLTLVFVSHHLPHALGHADRILGLRGGGLALDAASAHLDEPTLKDFYD